MVSLVQGPGVRGIILIQIARYCPNLEKRSHEMIVNREIERYSVYSVTKKDSLYSSQPAERTLFERRFVEEETINFKLFYF